VGWCIGARESWGERGLTLVESGNEDFVLGHGWKRGAWARVWFSLARVGGWSWRCSSDLRWAT